MKLDRPAILYNTPKSLRYDTNAFGKIAIVTICSYAPDEVVRVVSIENHRLYAEVHGYQLHMFLSPDEILPNEASKMNVKDGVHKPFFWKVNAVKNVFDGPDPPTWVLWADCDALFMDPERTLDSIIHMYTANQTNPLVRKPNTEPQIYEMVDSFLNRATVEKPNPPEISLLLAVDSTGINNGVWMMKRTQWSIDFLERW